MMRTSAEQIKNLLIFDPFWTLAYWWDEPLDRAADCRVGEDFVYKRPYLSEFLAACSEWYDIGVWTSGDLCDVEPVVEEVFNEPDRLQFVWGERIAFKDIADNLNRRDGFAWSPERVLIVQSSAVKGPTDTKNTVCPSLYQGDENDDELKYLATYLHGLKDSKNYRKTNKTNWRRRTKPMPW